MRRLFRSFGYAFKGLWYACRTQLNFRIHLVATLLAVYLGYHLRISVNEWLWVGLCVTLVLTAELFNTALEYFTDLVSPEYNKSAGHVKDISAAAVTIVAFFALITGLVIFLPKLYLFFL
jgi:diacylglycerol kinase